MGHFPPSISSIRIPFFAGNFSIDIYHISTSTGVQLKKQAEPSCMKTHEDKKMLLE